MVYSPFDLIELRVVFLHASPDSSNSLPEHHVGLRRHLPPGGAHLLVFILNWKLEISSKQRSNLYLLLTSIVGQGRLRA